MSRASAHRRNSQPSQASAPGRRMPAAQIAQNANIRMQSGVRAFAQQPKHTNHRSIRLVPLVLNPDSPTGVDIDPRYRGEQTP